MIGSSAKINDLRSVEIRAFERSKAGQLAALLLKSRGVELSEEAMEAFLDQIDMLLPIFIQILASAVASEARLRKQPVTADLIRECYEQRVRSGIPALLRGVLRATQPLLYG